MHYPLRFSLKFCKLINGSLWELGISQGRAHHLFARFELVRFQSKVASFVKMLLTKPFSNTRYEQEREIHGSRANVLQF